MKVKRFNGKPYGVELSNAEKRAMDMEINRQLLKKDEQFAEDLDALVLYTLLAHYGWKRKRLKKFWDAFIAEHKALREFYQMNDPGDNAWLAHRKLKQIGVDVHQWYIEEKKNEEENLL